MITIKWVPVVSQYNICCCKCTLKTGTIMVAWFGLFVEMIQVMDSITRLANYEDYVRQEEIRREQKELISEFDLQDESSANMDTDDFSSLSVSRGTLVGRTVAGLLHVLTQILLLYGAYKEKPSYMTSYVLYQFVWILFVSLILIALIIFLVFADPLIALLLLIFLGPFVALGIYLWCGVYTYYRQLSEAKLPPQDTQLQNLTYQEEQVVINTEDMQKAYAQVEYKYQEQIQPQAV